MSAPQADAGTDDEMNYFAYVYCMLEPYKSARFLPVTAFARPPAEGGVDLAPLFNRAGIQRIQLEAAARIHYLTTNWLFDNEFDAGAVATSMTLAGDHFAPVHRVLDQAVDAGLIEPAFPEEPQSITALRLAPGLAGLLLDWHEDGKLGDGAFREKAALMAARVAGALRSLDGPQVAVSEAEGPSSAGTSTVRRRSHHRFH